MTGLHSRKIDRLQLVSSVRGSPKQIRSNGQETQGPRVGVATYWGITVYGLRFFFRDQLVWPTFSRASPALREL